MAWIQKALALSVRAGILVPDFHEAEVKDIQAWVLSELENDQAFGVTITEEVSYANRQNIINNLARRPDRREWVEIIDWLKM